MKRNLQSIAKELSESDIQELIRIKKMGGKRILALSKKRDRLAAELEKVDAELAKLGGGIAAAPARKGRRGRPKTETADATQSTAKKVRRKTASRGRRTNLSAAVRQIFAQAGTPLRASQVVDQLPDAGIKVKDVSDMRKRISVVLASQKNNFEVVERGVYQLKEQEQ